MGVDEIITLESGTELRVLKEVIVDDDKYLIATPDLEAEIPLRFTVLIQSIEDGVEYVEEVDDQEFINEFVKNNLN